MRVLLDENLPVDLAVELSGHAVESVVGLGWSGITNGELLRRTAGSFEVLVTMDGNLEFQQPLGAQPFGVVVVRASSNRMRHLLPLVPEILSAVDGIGPGEVRRVGH